MQIAKALISAWGKISMPFNGAIWAYGYVALCLLLISGRCYVHGLGQSMADCLSVASKFRNTCPSLRNASNNIRDMPGQLVTCMDVGQCNDQTAGFQCSWVRQLCVTCHQAGDTVKIRVQSNGMPDHCYYSPMVAPRPKFIDYEVNFNTEVKTNRFSPTTSGELDSIVCNRSMVSDSQVPATYDFIRTPYDLINTVPPSPQLSLDKVVGVAINGVPFLTPLNDENIDTWSDSPQNRVKEPVDTCLGYTTSDGMYTYPLIPVCIHDIREPSLQADALHPMSRQFLCNWRDEGHDGKLSLEESPFEGPPKFQVRAYIGGDKSAYTISGAFGNPTLTLRRSKTYIFDVATNGHPFMIQYANGAAFLDGITIERSSWGDSGYTGLDRGTITFTVPSKAPKTLYYRCTRHTIHMVGELRIVSQDVSPESMGILPVGCDGVLGSGKEYDQCGRCGGTNEDKDACGVCFGDNTTCTGCDGVVNSGKVLDLCGVCGGGNDCIPQQNRASDLANSDSTANIVINSQPTKVSENTVEKIFQRRGQHILGVAKDGHAIYGPYYADGSEATAGVDVCNGAMLDTTGDKVVDTYGYFVRRNFPYTLSCYGPGNYPIAAKPSCTASAPIAYLPWLNFTYPGIAPVPFDNGDFQPRHKPNDVHIVVTSVDDSGFFRCMELEKHSDVQSGTALVGNGLRHMIKKITVVFPQPFILAPLIHQIHVNLNKSKVFQTNEYLLTVRSVDKEKFTFDVRQKDYRPWSDILFVNWHAVSARRLDCTLRSAVLEANFIDSANQQVLTTFKTNHTILDSQLSISGEGKLSINGPKGKVVISKGSAWRSGMIPMIRVANSKSTRCEISNAIFEKSIGGCILVQNGGSLSLQNSIIRSNYGIIKGSGMTIERDGIVEMTNVIFQHNYAQTSFLEGAAGGGALYVEAGASAYISGGLLEYNMAVNSRGDAFGGAILNYGKLTITSTLIQHNTAIGGKFNRHGESGHAGNGNGGAIYHDGEILSITDSTIFNNSASRSGGAVFFTGDIELTRCTVRNNSAYMGSAFRSLSYVNNPRLMDCDVFWNSCEIERSSGQAITESYYPGQKSIPFDGTHGYIHYAGLPQQQISYYDDL
eukprot:g13029.t1